MARNGWSEVRRALRDLTIGLLATGWLFGTPYLAFRAMFTGATLFGEPPTAEEVRAAHLEWRAALTCGFLFPLVGMVLGARMRSRAVVWGFGVALLVSFAAAALVMMNS